MIEPTPPVADCQEDKSILLVEDEEDIRSFISEAIQLKTKHCVISCGTAEQALAAASRQHFHLFILDYRLPEMSGLNLHDQLLAIPHLADVPTIMMSVYDPPSREMYRRHLILLDKPFRLAQLLNIIETVLI
jgi:DNA-binding NtrC family response regulator